MCVYARVYVIFQTKSSFYGEISSHSVASKLVLLTLHFPKVNRMFVYCVHIISKY